MSTLLIRDKTNYFSLLNTDIVSLISFYGGFTSCCGYHGCRLLTYYLYSNIKADYSPVIFVGYNFAKQLSAINFTCYNKPKVLKGKKWRLLLAAVEKDPTLLVYLFNKLDTDKKVTIIGLTAYIKSDIIIFISTNSYEKCFLPLPCVNAIKCWQKAAINIKKY